jgi:hypothetical protein
MCSVFPSNGDVETPVCPIGKDPVVKVFFVQTVTSWQSMSNLGHRLLGCSAFSKEVVRQLGA